MRLPQYPDTELHVQRVGRPGGRRLDGGPHCVPLISQHNHPMVLNDGPTPPVHTCKSLLIHSWTTGSLGFLRLGPLRATGIPVSCMATRSRSLWTSCMAFAPGTSCRRSAAAAGQPSVAAGHQGRNAAAAESLLLLLLPRMGRHDDTLAER